MTFDYQPTPLNILNNNKSIEIEYQPGSHMLVDGMAYRLLQFNFHSPSEHLIAGYRYPMEMQLVHVNKNGSLAIISILIEEGEANPEFQKIISNAPVLGMFEVADSFINVKALLPADASIFYNYTGSLTTPPCTEGVRWFVMEKTIQFSAEQIAIFQKIMPANARSVQNINLRSIYRGEE
jgi:carbonic anhydrase